MTQPYMPPIIPPKIPSVPRFFDNRKTLGVDGYNSPTICNSLVGRQRASNAP